MRDIILEKLNSFVDTLLSDFTHEKKISGCLSTKLRLNSADQESNRGVRKSSVMRNKNDMEAHKIWNKKVNFWEKRYREAPVQLSAPVIEC